MPNRIIKESICTSDNIDRLTSFEETVFIRLIVNCDDFGRFDGREKVLSSRLFPLKTVTPEQMKKALQSLVAADLVTVYEVDGRPYVHLNSWDKHQTRRASKSKYPDPGCNQMKSFASNCKQEKPDESKNPRIRNRIRESINDNRNRESFMDDDEAHKIQQEQNTVIDAAEKAGFAATDYTRGRLVAMYVEYGLQKMIDAIGQCAEHGATTLAYLQAVLTGKPKAAKPAKAVVAQQYGQRDYTDVQAELIAEQNREMEEFLRKGAG